MNGIVALCHFCESHGPSVLFCTQSFHGASNAASSSSFPLANGHSGDGQQLPSPATARPGCPSCSSIPETHKGFSSYDPEAQTTYISSRSPLHSDLYATVRQSCVRSLSCEFAPGREGPVLFGDAKNGYTLAYMFKLKDSMARGLQRFYCLLFLMTDHIFLVASWPFIVRNFRLIARDMQVRAEMTFEKDANINRKKADALGTRTLSSRALIASEHVFKHRSKNYSRSLAELLDHQDYFAHLHAFDTWMLKSCAHRLFEHQLEPFALSGVHVPVDNSAPSRLAASISSFSLGDSYNDEVGNDDTPARKIPNVQFTSLSEVRRVLRPETFDIVVYHVSIGNQVIVRGASPYLTTSLLARLQELLPPSCCQVVPYETQYQDAWKCNFLGLANGVEIPSHVDRSTYVLIDVRYDAYDDMVNSASFANHDKESDKFKPFYFNVVYGSRPRSSSSLMLATAAMDFNANTHTNTYTSQIEAILSHASGKLVDVQIMMLKEEWINKTKLFFKFSRSSSADTEDKIKKFVKVLGLKESDMLVMKFWTTGINKAQRGRLLNLNSV